MSNKSLTDLAKEYSAEVAKEFDWKPHVFPRYKTPVIIERDGKREVVPMNFGLIPSFEMNEKPKMVFHNARSETLKEKASFKKAYVERRCLIPVDSFFEFVDSDEINPKTKKLKKQLIEFAPKNKESLTAAGIWSLWKNSGSGEVTANFSMITRDPPEFILNNGHDRCPLFLENSKKFEWIDTKLNTYDQLDLFLAQNRAEIQWEVRREII